MLQFGLANNDSQPAASYVTDGTNIYGSTVVRPLNNRHGSLMIAGNASYTGGTTIFGGVMTPGTAGAGIGSILGNVAFCSDATNPLCDTSTNKVLAFNRSDTYTFGGVISGPGQVYQIGTGTTVLSGASTYTGPTFVEAGTLTVNGSLRRRSRSTRATARRPGAGNSVRIAAGRSDRHDRRQGTFMTTATWPSSQARSIGQIADHAYGTWPERDARRNRARFSRAAATAPRPLRHPRSHQCDLHVTGVTAINTPGFGGTLAYTPTVAADDALRRAIRTSRM